MLLASLPGTIIILNGASSSGKTSIVKALQTATPSPFLNAGIDTFIWTLPARYLDAPLWQEVFQYTWSSVDAYGRRDLTIRPGLLGDRLISGMHHAIAALARAGNHVVADHVLLASHWVDECAQLFDGLPAWLIGVRCPLEVLEAREKARRDRTIGQAKAQHFQAHVYLHGMYDLELDTSLLSPLECAVKILALIQSGIAPHGFSKLLTNGARNANEG